MKKKRRRTPTRIELVTSFERNQKQPSSRFAMLLFVMLTLFCTTTNTVIMGDNDNTRGAAQNNNNMLEKTTSIASGVSDSSLPLRSGAPGAAHAEQSAASSVLDAEISTNNKQQQQQQQNYLLSNEINNRKDFINQVTTTTASCCGSNPISEGRPLEDFGQEHDNDIKQKMINDNNAYEKDDHHAAAGVANWKAGSEEEETLLFLLGKPVEQKTSGKSHNDRVNLNKIAGEKTTPPPVPREEKKEKVIDFEERFVATSTSTSTFASASATTSTSKNPEAGAKKLTTQVTDLNASETEKHKQRRQEEESKEADIDNNGGEDIIQLLSNERWQIEDKKTRSGRRQSKLPTLALGPRRKKRSQNQDDSDRLQIKDNNNNETTSETITIINNTTSSESAILTNNEKRDESNKIRAHNNNNNSNNSDNNNSNNNNITATTKVVVAREAKGEEGLQGDESSKGEQKISLTIQAEQARTKQYLKCRVEENLYLDFEEYKQYTCSNCYNLMPKSLFNGKFFFKKESRRKVWLFDRLNEKIIMPNETDLIRPTFKDEQAFKKWNECCRHAIDCCQENSKYLAKNKTKILSDNNYELLDDWPRNKCHATWDGLSCWPDTQAGVIAEHDCPNHVYFFDFTPTCNGRVTKQCFPNGTWYIRADHEWSDYSNCAVLTLYATRLLIGSVWHVVSAFIIGPALMVLNRFPNRGGSKRVRILSNLLFWLLVNGLLAATQKMAIIGGVFHKANPDEPLPPPPAHQRASPVQLSQVSLPLPSAQVPLSLTRSSTTTTSLLGQPHSNNYFDNNVYVGIQNGSQYYATSSNLAFTDTNSDFRRHRQPMPLTGSQEAAVVWPNRLTLKRRKKRSIVLIQSNGKHQEQHQTDEASFGHIKRQPWNEQSYQQQQQQQQNPLLLLDVWEKRFHSAELSHQHLDQSRSSGYDRKKERKKERRKLAPSTTTTTASAEQTVKGGADDRTPLQGPPTSLSTLIQQTTTSTTYPNEDDNMKTETNLDYSGDLVDDLLEAVKEQVDEKYGDVGVGGQQDEDVESKNFNHYFYSSNTKEQNLNATATSDNQTNNSGVIFNAKKLLPIADKQTLTTTPVAINTNGASYISERTTKVAPTSDFSELNYSKDDNDGIEKPFNNNNNNNNNNEISSTSMKLKDEQEVEDDKNNQNNDNIGPKVVCGGQEPPPLSAATSTSSYPSIGVSRCKRSASNGAASYGSKKQQQSAPVVLICWIFSLGIRITRQLGYAWMFTGAVYLCSVLHFAPAEPPSLFIKWLMILTNGFPVVIGLVYIIARTIYDRSPLTLLVKLPYYYIMGDSVYVEYLWATQLDCWLSESKYSFIEEIADFPNLVLVILNGALFVVTLIIMCRINRPGSTRQEMSLGDYFKAAGTLVLLYGAHYMLIAYRVQVEGCIQDQVIYYSFLFVDGIQGIAVSYVFCYRTPEGKEIISKWWLTCIENATSSHGWLSCFGCKKKARQGREQALLGSNKKFNQSTRSNNSNSCNGKGDMVTTELISIKDSTPTANRNF